MGDAYSENEALCAEQDAAEAKRRRKHRIHRWCKPGDRPGGRLVKVRRIDKRTCQVLLELEFDSQPPIASN